MEAKAKGCPKCGGGFQIQYRANVGECADAGAPTDTGCSYQIPDAADISLHDARSEHLQAICASCGYRTCLSIGPVRVSKAQRPAPRGAPAWLTRKPTEG